MRDGVTLIELLLTIAIGIVIALVLSNFQADIFTLQMTTRDSLSVQHDVRTFLKTIVAELRSAQSSDVGGYTIEAAGTNTLVFYTDRDNDGARERVRYFIEADNLRRGVTVSSGAPPVYILGSEQVTTVVASLIDTALPIFSYYGAGYAPTAVPLSEPVDVSRVRLVKIQVSADVNPNRSPGIISGTSEVSIRNLKDNL